jgi:hypothetical protein
VVLRDTYTQLQLSGECSGDSNVEIMRSAMSAILIILVTILQFGNVVDGALSTIVESGEEECFAFRAPAGKNVIIR